MKRTAVADLVRDYLHAVEPLYTSREPANLKSALARLVSTKSDQLADELNADQLTRKARKLAENRDLSTSYRRACLARWKRFLSWAVEHEHAKAEDLIRFDAACRSLRFPGKRENHEMSSGSADVFGACTPRFGPGPLFDPLAVFAAAERVADTLPRVPADLLRLLAFTGARPVELLRLRPVDLVFDFFAINEPSAVAVLRHHKTAHHGRPRYVVFGPRARTILDRHLRPFTPHDWIFPAPTNPTLHASTNWLAQLVRRACRRHRLPPLKLYDIRRAAATLTRAREGLDVAQALLGHADARTTERYARPELEHARRAASHLEEASR